MKTNTTSRNSRMTDAEYSLSLEDEIVYLKEELQKERNSHAIFLNRQLKEAKNSVNKLFLSIIKT